ncbi:MAG: DUF5916 domain-containing protein, partial [Bacteroidota bacterium]
FRSAALNYKHWLFTDFGGQLNYIDWDVEVAAVFQNNWQAKLGFFSQPHVYSRTLLLGGPRMRLPEQYGFWWGGSSDVRKQLSFSYNGWTKTGGEDSYFLLDNSLNITYQPLDQFNISLLPKFTMINHRLQYVSTASFEDQLRYLTARLDQRTMSMALRMNYAITPDLTIQYFAQPFLSTGQYKDYAYVRAASAKSQAEQLHFFNQQQLNTSSDETVYQVDENGDGKVNYTFQNPDFSFAQFQSNLVLRYEYKSGSEIFLVWSQGLRDQQLPAPRFFDNIENQFLASNTVHNFLMKLTYRFY